MIKYNVQDTCSPRYTKLSPLQRRSIALQILQGALTISEANDIYNIQVHDTITKWFRLLKKENVDISILKADVVQEEDLSKPENGELEELKAALLAVKWKKERWKAKTEFVFYLAYQTEEPTRGRKLINYEKLA